MGGRYEARRLQGEIEEWECRRKQRRDPNEVARYLATLGSTAVDHYGCPVDTSALGCEVLYSSTHETAKRARFARDEIVRGRIVLHERTSMWVPPLDHPTVERGLVEPVEAHLVDTVVTDGGESWHFFKVVQIGPSEFVVSHQRRGKL